ncbi:MAG: GHMP kinase [Bacteroidia bacterium]|nr:GHMP kinase [Bacteroidia bacterium]
MMHRENQIRSSSYPRAALIGNPSDGYFGKTIAFVFKNFKAEVVLTPSDKLEIVPHIRDRFKFENMSELCEDIDQFGYYGGVRLLKASIKRFSEYCKSCEIELEKKNFRLSYQSTIPLRLGLAGSSAIITACIKALKTYYQIDIPPHLQANLVLATEREELGIEGGLQDRVAQSFEVPVFMDFNRDLMESRGYGAYEVLPVDKLPPLYIAYRRSLSSGSELVHNDLRARYNAGDQKVHEAIQQFTAISDHVRVMLIHGAYDELGSYIDQNFDLRRSIINISQENLRMVELARNTGASAKFTGSGGAIIGTYKNESMFEELKRNLSEEDIEVIKPEIISKHEEISQSY